MNHPSVRRSALTAASLAAVILFTACQDKRVKELNTGITRDSVMSVISKDVSPNARADSFPNVYKRNRYLISGKNYEVLYFTSNNEKAGKEDIPLRKLTPLVLVDNKLIGRGWGFWDSVSKANRIPVEH